MNGSFTPPRGWLPVDRRRTARRGGLHLTTWVWSGSAYVVPSAMGKAAVHAMTMSLASSGPGTASGSMPSHPANPH